MKSKHTKYIELVVRFYAPQNFILDGVIEKLVAAVKMFKIRAVIIRLPSGEEIIK